MLSDSYPDTVNYVLAGCAPKDNMKIYAPKESREYFLFGKSWEELLGRIDSRTIMMFIYNADTAAYYYDKTGDCSLLIGKEVKRIDVTMDYLNNNNYTITYP